jgi:hypothetical protein
MPNQLKNGTLRVSYVEEVRIHRALKILAASKGVSMSLLMRQATGDFLNKEDPAGTLLKSSDELSQRYRGKAGSRGRT